MTFGPEISGRSDCPECGKTMELSFNSSDFFSLTETGSPNEVLVEGNGRELRFRLPTSVDLLAISSAEQLLERCLLGGGDRVTENLHAAVGEKMSGADPMADIHLALNCPNCQQAWNAPFDIVAFLWREISAAARRLLREVHMLASAYGWTETEILSLSPARRRAYLELATG
jgi:hypothetical protein